MIVPELPKTRSGKIMRRLLRDVAEHREVGDVTTLADSTVMDLIKDKEGAGALRVSRPGASFPWYPPTRRQFPLEGGNWRRVGTLLVETGAGSASRVSREVWSASFRRPSRGAT